VGYNNVFGYYIEITNTHKDRVPVDYIRKQTITNAERYITPALKEQEEKILHAEERMVALETSLFHDVRMQVAAQVEGMQRNAAALAQLDCLVSLATVAVEYSYVRPEVDNSTTMEIIGGRHPVIERLLPPGEQYVPNDLILDTAKDQILIITGPNMSGKSSYLRQVGLIVLLAQIGSYVPATRAVIGLVDKIFTRVGASDNIASGESTFLVEMHEAAHIVNSATSRSLILLDEVGRGTSTFDGISIAWSLTEYLHERLGARTLFATHYHEMNELADRFARIRNYKVDVREYGDKVVFLHKVTPGAADHSYGIHVAKMAGLPEEITTRATAILHQLEGAAVSVEGKEASTSKRAHLGDNPLQLTLFVDDPLREALKAVDVDRLTPLEALQLISTLKRKADPS
jgi:DNA mismatch repair protein MutS